MKTETQIKKLLKVLSEGIFEKEHILAMALLSAIAGESIFLLGPPGTAKSLVARRLKLAFKDAQAFEYLMSRFSTPDEIFGPVSISLLKNEDRYERVVDGFLPTATIVFLDEIWKASPSIQNALLTAINERVFQNGKETLALPMKGLIAASNELPAEDEGLEALWDRFLVRMVSNCIQSETAFYKMIREQTEPTPCVEEECLITEEIYNQWNEEIKGIGIPDEICGIVTTIRKGFQEEAKKEGVNGMDYYVSDRRWKKCFHLMQTSAFLNGRKSIDRTDIPILLHCLWNKAETIQQVVEVVCRSLTADIETRMVQAENEINKALKQKAAEGQMNTQEPNKADQFSLANFFYYTIKNFPKGKCLFYKADYNHVKMDKPMDGIIYLDNDKKAWIVHAIYTGAPFSYKERNAGNTKRVKLLKCNGGIVIDGIPFAFERLLGTPRMEEELFGQTTFEIPNEADVVIDSINKEIRPEWDKLQTLFTKTKNLFLSDDDTKMVRKYLTKCDKRINEVLVKAQNAKQLL